MAHRASSEASSGYFERRWRHFNTLYGVFRSSPRDQAFRAPAAVAVIPSKT